MSNTLSGTGAPRAAEVVIVGAGPTGLTLAYELSLAGIETVVLERLPRRIEQMKGGAVQPRSAELFELRGLLEPLLRRALPREQVGGHFAALPVPLDCTPWDTRHPFPLTIPQGAFEAVLEERATARGARVLRGAEVESVEQDDDGVSVTADGIRIRARHLVACDGGHSTVRRLLGLPFPGRPGTRVATLADIRLSAVSPLVPRRIEHMSSLTRRTGGHWAMLIPAGGDAYRFTFGHVGQTETDRDVPVTHEEIATALRVLYGEETTLAAVDSVSRFGDATRQLDQYRAGRVLFAGDAAHIHPPLGGQGLNLGVQDAFNLGWKLAATLRGRAPAALLDTYQSERHPVAAQVLHHTSAQRVLALQEPDGDVAALRDIFVDLLRLPDTNRHLAGLMSGLSLRYELPGEHPLVGRRTPDADLVTAAGPTRLSALFHEGKAVLLDLSGSAAGSVRPPDGVEPVVARATRSLGATALLIRPDGYVSWATDSADPWRAHRELPSPFEGVVEVAA